MSNIDLESEFDTLDGNEDHSSLEELVELGKEMVSLETNVSDLEDALSGVKARLHNLKTNVIPDAMASIGLDSLTLSDGTELKVSDFVSGALPKDPIRKEGAIKWLEDHGGAGIIKSQVYVNFGRAEHDSAKETERLLTSAGLHPVMETMVHPQTLCSYARELLSSGDEFDPTVLGLFVGRTVKSKMKKK